MKVASPLSLVVLAMTLCACAPVLVTPVGEKREYAQVGVEQVLLYRSKDQVPGKYEELAFLSVHDNFLFSSEEYLYKTLRKKAASLGANGVLIESVSNPSASAKIANIFINTPANMEIRAAAIRVTGK